MLGRENQKIIQVKNLKKVYYQSKREPGLKNLFKNFFQSKKEKKIAVKSISFEIERGEFVGFLGPNGAGKTTTLKMLSGIIHPDSGSARILGFEPWQREAEYQKQFSMVMGQKSQLWWDLPAIESFLLNKAIYEIGDQDFQSRLDELTELLEAKGLLNKQVRQMSLGERMKCELIASILHRPKVLFLDEPTIGLDVVAQKNIRDFLRRYNEKNKTTILLTSHYMGDILKLCKRIIIINKGKIIYDGLIRTLIDQYADSKIITVYSDRAPKKEAFDKFGKIIDSDQAKTVIEVPRKKVKKVAAQMLASRLPIKDIDIAEPGIESIIRNIFKSGK